MSERHKEDLEQLRLEGQMQLDRQAENHSLKLDTVKKTMETLRVENERLQAEVSSHNAEIVSSEQVLILRQQVEELQSQLHKYRTAEILKLEPDDMQRARSGMRSTLGDSNNNRLHTKSRPEPKAAQKPKVILVGSQSAPQRQTKRTRSNKSLHRQVQIKRTDAMEAKSLAQKSAKPGHPSTPSRRPPPAPPSSSMPSYPAATPPMNSVSSSTDLPQRDASPADNDWYSRQPSTDAPIQTLIQQMESQITPVPTIVKSGLATPTGLLLTTSTPRRSHGFDPAEVDHERSSPTVAPHITHRSSTRVDTHAQHMSSSLIVKQPQATSTYCEPATATLAPPTDHPEANPATAIERHYWYGCGKLRERMVEMKKDIMKHRSRIASLGLDPVPHPDTWMAKHPPKRLDHISEEDAYWYGCARCRWQLSVHERIFRECSQRLQRHALLRADTKHEGALYTSPSSSRMRTMIQLPRHAEHQMAARFENSAKASVNASVNAHDTKAQDLE